MTVISNLFPSDYKTGGESGHGYQIRCENGFFEKYLSGNIVLDIGYAAGGSPVVPHATGVDLGYKGYDGNTLPFEDASVDCVYSSHCLEHMDNTDIVIKDWHRILKVGGYIVCIVPHQYLYEKKLDKPSRYNGSHIHFFTSGILLRMFEENLVPNSYRIRHLRDNDDGFDYNRGPDLHSSGRYEIELVIEKIQLPNWQLL